MSGHRDAQADPIVAWRPPVPRLPAPGAPAPPLARFIQGPVGNRQTGGSAVLSVGVEIVHRGNGVFFKMQKGSST